MRHLTLDQVFNFPQLSIITAELMLPPSPGLYFVLEHTPNRQIIYIGKANNLQQRWRNHHRTKDLLMLEAVGVELTLAYTPGVVSYSESMLYADESFLIQKFKPLLNGWSTPIKVNVITDKLIEKVKEKSAKLGWLSVESIKAEFPAFTKFEDQQVTDMLQELAAKGVGALKDDQGFLEWGMNVDAPEILEEAEKLENFALSEIKEISKRQGWVSASIAKQCSHGLRIYSPDELRDLFKILCEAGEGELNGEGDTLEWRLSSVPESLDFSVFFDISRKHGWISASKAKAFCRALRPYTTDEIREMFNHLCSEGKGVIKGEGGSLEWSCKEPSEPNGNMGELDLDLEDPWCDFEDTEAS